MFYSGATDIGDPRTPIPLGVMVSSAMKLQLRVFGFLSNTRVNKRKQNALTIFLCVYLHAQTAVHTPLTNHGYFDRGKHPNTPNWSPCWDKDYGTGSGISGLYL